MDTPNSHSLELVANDTVQILSLDKKFDQATVYVQPYFEESSRSFVIKGRGKRRESPAPDNWRRTARVVLHPGP